MPRHPFGGGAAPLCIACPERSGRWKGLPERPQAASESWPAEALPQRPQHTPSERTPHPQQSPTCGAQRPGTAYSRGSSRPHKERSGGEPARSGVHPESSQAAGLTGKQNLPNKEGFSWPRRRRPERIRTSRPKGRGPSAVPPSPSGAAQLRWEVAAEPGPDSLSGDSRGDSSSPCAAADRHHLRLEPGNPQRRPASGPPGWADTLPALSVPRKPPTLRITSDPGRRHPGDEKEGRGTGAGKSSSALLGQKGCQLIVRTPSQDQGPAAHSPPTSPFHRTLEPKESL